MIDFRDELLKLSSDKYQKFQYKLIPNISNIMGVQIPKIRKLCRNLTEEEKRYYLNKYNKEYLEEVILMGLIICDLKCDINKILSYTKEYAKLIDNWCSCDIFCSSFHITKKNQKLIFEFLKEYLQSDDEYYIRFGLVMLLNYYICDDYIDEIFKIIDKVKVSKYYDKMALAWLISMIYIKYKEKTISYLMNCNLDEFTYNKSLQKIIESNRVSNEDKEFIKKLKKH